MRKKVGRKEYVEANAVSMEHVRSSSDHTWKGYSRNDKADTGLLILFSIPKAHLQLNVGL